MKNKIVISLLIGVILSTSMAPNQVCLAAQQTSNSEKLYSEVEKDSLSTEEMKAIQTFLANGYSEKQLSDFTMDFIVDIAKDLKNDPNSVEISTQVQNFDEIENVEIAVNLSETELVNECGLTRAEAKKIKNQINSLQKMSRAEKKANYNMNNDEVAVLEKALKPQKNYKPNKNVDEKVTLSSSISSSKLSYTQAVSDYSTTKSPKYKVKISFNWKKCYYWGDFSDTVAVAWGGGLNYKSSSKSVTYYNVYGIWPAFTWASKSKGTKSPSASESPNKAVKYTFGQSYSSSMSNIARAKKGSFSLYISNTKKKGYKTNVVSRYCHKKIGVGSINVSGTPSISVSGSYDSTDTDDASNTIKY